MGSKIIFEGQSRKQLRFHEVNAILLLLDYFDTDITCIHPGSGKTPDLKINGIEWELKSPQGDSAKTIENILKKATKQSKNIILDFSRIKMNGNQALSRTKYYLHNNKHGIKKLIIITKNHKVIDFKDEL
ncbi:hypothetical protein IKG28_02815 [Candidatus Saccharibacteria bacterium]|nr:hypothetical protein [Candidatus Saccharibacteria bacterium]